MRKRVLKKSVFEQSRPQIRDTEAARRAAPYLRLLGVSRICGQICAKTGFSRIRFLKLSCDLFCCVRPQTDFIILFYSFRQNYCLRGPPVVRDGVFDRFVEQNTPSLAPTEHISERDTMQMKQTTPDLTRHCVDHESSPRRPQKFTHVF